MGARKAYLGDGLYYKSEHGCVILTAEDGVRVLNEVFLEPEVIVALLRELARDYDPEKLRAVIGTTGEVRHG